MKEPLPHHNSGERGHGDNGARRRVVEATEAHTGLAQLYFSLDGQRDRERCSARADRAENGARK